MLLLLAGDTSDESDGVVVTLKSDGDTKGRNCAIKVMTSHFSRGGLILIAVKLVKKINSVNLLKLQNLITDLINSCLSDL